MPLSNKRLTEIVVELTRRPGHTKVGTLIQELLVHGLGARSEDIEYEVQQAEVRGRSDGLFGRTVLEFKSNLRREKADAEEQLSRYIPDRERETGDRFVGIATDGAQFVAYDYRDNQLRELTSYIPSADEPADLLQWLNSAVIVTDDLKPDAETVRKELVSLPRSSGHLRLWRDARPERSPGWPHDTRQSSASGRWS
jgi:hypothetical protein